MDVTLDDGTIIKSGEPITPEQIKRVVVHEDITFTVYHDPIPKETPSTTPKVPNTGAGLSAAKIGAITTVGVALTIILASVAIKLSPRVFRKRVSFKKRG